MDSILHKRHDITKQYDSLTRKILWWVIDLPFKLILVPSFNLQKSIWRSAAFYLMVKILYIGWNLVSLCRAVGVEAMTNQPLTNNMFLFFVLPRNSIFQKLSLMIGSIKVTPILMTLQNYFWNQNKKVKSSNGFWLFLILCHNELNETLICHLYVTTAT